jgi:hypothetical protein
LIAEICCLNWLAHGERKGGGGGQARQRPRRRWVVRSRGGRKKEGRGWEGRLTGGAGVSVEEEKRERDGGAWAAAGERKAGCWAAGPKGKGG